MSSKLAVEKCEDCGTTGTVEDGHELWTSGRLMLGTLRPHIFCRDCARKRRRAEPGATYV